MTTTKAQRGHNTTQTAPESPTVPSRAILEDRYDGLLGTPQAEWSTKLWKRLHGALMELYEGTARVEWDGEGNASGAISDEALELLREHFVSRIDELGLAR